VTQPQRFIARRSAVLGAAMAPGIVGEVEPRAARGAQARGWDSQAQADPTAPRRATAVVRSRGPRTSRWAKAQEAVSAGPLHASSQRGGRGQGHGAEVEVRRLRARRWEYESRDEWEDAARRLGWAIGKNEVVCRQCLARAEPPNGAPA
jgi:hypothetical protein